MSRPESRFSVRPARPSDGNGLLLLARELAHGPLLSRYAADEARLGAELSALADSDHRTETLLIAEETASHAESAESVDAAGRLCALARFSHAGMFGRLGGYLQLIAVAPSQRNWSTGKAGGRWILFGKSERGALWTGFGSGFGKNDDAFKAWRSGN